MLILEMMAYAEYVRQFWKVLDQLRLFRLMFILKLIGLIEASFVYNVDRRIHVRSTMQHPYN